MMARLKLASILLLNCFTHFLVDTSHVTSNVSATFRGLIPSTFTPVDSKGYLNVDIVQEYARFLKQYGMVGVLVAGSAGEGGKFTVDEKKLLIDAWLSAGRDQNLKVIVQVGGIPLPDAKNLASYSEAAGADAILTLPELYYKPDTPEKLVYFLKEVADAAPNTPLFYYHIPQSTYVDVDMEKTFDLASIQIPSFAGMKVELDVAVKLKKRRSSSKAVIVADSTFLGPAVLYGFDSFIMTDLGIFPQLAKDIFANGQLGNLNKTRALSQILVNYKSAITKDRDVVPAFKEAMNLVTGIQVGQARPPEMPLNSTEIKKLEASLRSEGIYFKGCES